jgi:hypothetical protein
MSKRVVKDLVYDASVEEVSAMMQDPAFRTLVLERLRVLRGDAKVQDGVVTIEQVLPARGLPSFATKIVGDEITTLQVERWTSVDHADVDVSIPGKPGDMAGSVSLKAAGEQTVETVDMEVTIRLPLIGGKIESLIAEMLGKALDVEHRTGAEWLARA